MRPPTWQSFSQRCFLWDFQRGQVTRSALESLGCVRCPQLLGSGGIRLRLRLDGRGKGRLPREAFIGLGVERLGAVEEKGGLDAIEWEGTGCHIFLGPLTERKKISRDRNGCDFDARRP